MAVVDTWDGANRRIYLAIGVTEFHPIDDIYREYRTARRLDETFRVWNPFMVAVGNEPKGGGKFTSRYLYLLDGVRIVAYDQGGEIDVTGEIVTEDQLSPFDNSSLTQPVVINYTPPDTEVIQVSTTGVPPELEDAINSIDANLILIQSDLGNVHGGVFGQKLIRHSAVPTGVDREPGYIIMWEDDGTTLIGYKEAWEDEDKTIGYRGRGSGWESVLLAGLPPGFP